MNHDINITGQILKSVNDDSHLCGTSIEVTVTNGHAVLSGHVDKFCKKHLAYKIAKDVAGVSSVKEEIQVELNPGDNISDNAILTAISETFKKNFGASWTDINVVVKDGYVWLDGVLKWKYQKDLAGDSIGCIDGIRWIENNITVPEALTASIDEKDILAAIYRDRSITTDIKVQVLGHRVILKGCVESFDQKNLVTRLVRNVNGVSEIENFLSIDWMS